MTQLEINPVHCAGSRQAIEHEWLIGNGIGGFAAGTIAEANTRRYHGLLLAALTPPGGRTLMVSKLDLSVHYLGRDYALFSNEFADGTIAPEGYLHLQSFHLDQGLPVWRYAVADALIEKRILMQPGRNATWVELTVLRAAGPLALTLTPLCAYRDYHGHTQGGWIPNLQAGLDGFEITAFPGARTTVSVASRPNLAPGQTGIGDLNTARKRRAASTTRKTCFVPAISVWLCAKANAPACCSAPKQWMTPTLPPRGGKFAANNSCYCKGCPLPRRTGFGNWRWPPINISSSVIKTANRPAKPSSPVTRGLATGAGIP